MTGSAAVADYQAGSARLRLAPIRIGPGSRGTLVATRMTLDGPLADGRVEVIAEGSRDHCERLLKVLRSGESPGSVEHVAERWSDPKGGLEGFVER